jgi:hypothetical protein
MCPLLHIGDAAAADHGERIALTEVSAEIGEISLFDLA